jgi:hypothetical protein
VRGLPPALRVVSASSKAPSGCAVIIWPAMVVVSCGWLGSGSVVEVSECALAVERDDCCEVTCGMDVVESLELPSVASLAEWCSGVLGLDIGPWPICTIVVIRTTDEVVDLSSGTSLKLDGGGSGLLLDGDKGKYVKDGHTPSTIEDCCPKLVDSSDEVVDDDCIELSGSAVTFAGPSSTGLEEAGGIVVWSAAVVGTAILAALVKAMGGSHEPRQSRSHVAQAGSIPRM